MVTILIRFPVYSLSSFYMFNKMSLTVHFIQEIPNPRLQIFASNAKSTPVNSTWRKRNCYTHNTIHCQWNHPHFSTNLWDIWLQLCQWGTRQRGRRRVFHPTSHSGVAQGSQKTGSFPCSQQTDWVCMLMKWVFAFRNQASRMANEECESKALMSDVN